MYDSVLGNRYKLCHDPKAPLQKLLLCFKGNLKEPAGRNRSREMLFLIHSCFLWISNFFFEFIIVYFWHNIHFIHNESEFTCEISEKLSQVGSMGGRPREHERKQKKEEVTALVRKGSRPRAGQGLCQAKDCPRKSQKYALVCWFWLHGCSTLPFWINLLLDTGQFVNRVGSLLWGGFAASVKTWEDQTVATNGQPSHRYDIRSVITTRAFYDEHKSTLVVISHFSRYFFHPT